MTTEKSHKPDDASDNAAPEDEEKEDRGKIRAGEIEEASENEEYIQGVVGPICSVDSRRRMLVD